MLIRRFWKNCDDCHGDALWVEATEAEAVSVIFPRLTDEAVAASRTLVEQSGHMARMMGRAEMTFCFLIARNLTVIRPHQPHYPVHQLWNAYSPFRMMPEMEVKSLDALRYIAVPDDEEDDEECD